MELIKKYDLSTIKNKLFSIVFLNITDIIFTRFLLKTGMYIEGNALIKNVVDDRVLSYSIKTIIPALLMLYLYIRLKSANQRQLVRANRFINVVFILYVLINISHLVWIGLYFYLK